MTPEEARRMVRRVYGRIEQAKELHRDERSFIFTYRQFAARRSARS
jgi:hypothetical protein